MLFKTNGTKTFLLKVLDKKKYFSATYVGLMKKIFYGIQMFSVSLISSIVIRLR